MEVTYEFMRERDRKEIEEIKHNILNGADVAPIICLSSGRILDGAHRAIACRELGIEVPAIVLDIPIKLVNPNELFTWMEKREA